MNKLFTKIAGVTLGFAMAIGVGVAVAGKQDVKAAKADTDEISISDVATANHWVNETAYTSWSLNSDITIATAGTGNNGKYYSSNFSWRLYENGNGALTLTGSEGVELSSVTFTYTYKEKGTLYKGSNNYNSGTAISISGSTYSFDGVKHTSGTKSANIQITAISITYTKPSSKELLSIAVTTAPTKITYSEGELFDNTGMVITATYDDESTENPTDYTWSPNGALTPSDTYVTISWGGKSTTQPITVNAKVVSSIAVQTMPTKTSYHAGEAFASTGLVIRVTYEGGSTADITTGFTIAPSSYTFTAADELAGSKTFTVTYSGKSTTFDVTVAPITGPLGNGGRYYIMTSDFAYGLNAAASAEALPAVVDMSADNQLTAFDVTLVGDNEYTITTTIDATLYYLVANTTATSSNNNQLRITSTPDANLKSLNWSLFKTVTQGEDSFTIDVEGAYFVRENTVGTTNRYLSMYKNQDWRGYNNVYNTTSSAYNGDPQIQFVTEGAYAAGIVNSLTNTLTCDVDGENAPSTTTWGNISEAFGNVTIKHEKDILKNAEYTKTGSGSSTVVVAKEGTEQAVAEAVAKYDYIVGKYNKGQGITDYNDFLNRDPAAIAGSNFNAFGANESNEVATIVVIIAIASISAFGCLLILKKRKHQ